MMVGTGVGATQGARVEDVGLDSVIWAVYFFADA